jgi:hypothetical protein
VSHCFFDDHATFGCLIELHFSFCFTNAEQLSFKYLELKSPRVDANHTSISSRLSPEGVLPVKMGLDEVDLH